MVDQLSTEEQQIAALKKWWNDNGNSILIGIGLALAIVFGWKAYQNNLEAQQAESSALYQQLLSAATMITDETGAEEGSVAYLATELKDKFADTEYGIYAALFLAKDAVTKNDLDKAVAELNWVLGATEDQRLKHTVKGRLARILAAQGKTSEALDLLSASDEAYKARFLEISGDIQKRSGDEEAAISSYKEAYSLVKDTPQMAPLLAVKLSDLGVDPATL